MIPTHFSRSLVRLAVLLGKLLLRLAYALVLEAPGVQRQQVRLYNYFRISSRFYNSYKCYATS